MKKSLLNGFGVLAIAVLAIACKKETVNDNFTTKPNTKSNSSTSAFTTTDVFVGGIYNYQGVNNNVLQYWTNTIGPYALTLSTDKHNFVDIETSGTDLYILSNQVIGAVTSFTPKYWKNGTPTTLTKPTGSNYAVASAIAISGTTVYVAGIASYNTPSGYSQSRAVLWTNGIPNVIGDATYNTYVTDLVIAGGIPYTTGAKSPIGSSTTTSVYWANTTETTLPSGTSQGVFAAVAGSDIYMTSIIGSYASASIIVWKNGAIYTAFTGGPDEYASGVSIATSGNDVYLVANGRTYATGYENNVFVWKNSGLPFRTLTSAPYSGTSATPYYTAYLKGLRVSSGGDVYILGCTNISDHGYWKNNTFNTLSKPSVTYAQGIALMEY